MRIKKVAPALDVSSKKPGYKIGFSIARLDFCASPTSESLPQIHANSSMFLSYD
jgi:hypothetical protein